MGLIRRRLWGAFALAVVIAGCFTYEDPFVPEDVAESIVETRTLSIEGEARRYLLVVPGDLPATGGGLILAIHGADGSGLQLRATSDVDRLAKDTRSILVFPDASHRNWAEDCGCIQADSVHGSADTLLISRLIDQLVPEFSLDADRVFATGFSQGGLFVQRLACQMSDRIRGVAMVATTFSLQLHDRCAPARPIDWLLILSQQDIGYPWEGNVSPPFTTIGAENTHLFWNTANGCEVAALDTDLSTHVRIVSTGCADGVKTELLGIDGGIHTWFVSQFFDVSAEIARHFGT